MVGGATGKLIAMHSVEVSTHLDSAEAASVRELIRQAEDAHGYRPVSDQFWIDLLRDAAHDVIRIRIHETDDDVPVAYAQVSAAALNWSIETVIRPDRRNQLAEAMRLMLDATVAAILASEATSPADAHADIDLSWLVFAPTPEHDAIAAEFKLTPTRRLFQMYRELPTDVAYSLETRPFEPGRDDAAWLEVNQRAFAWNPDQGTWSHETLQSRIAEPWFEAPGFLLHERHGRLAGFCWTKVHHDTSPPVGEIYVVAVDPAFHGQGLGRSLTLAGLDSLAKRGITMGMLFVDADNTAAVALYYSLGFTVRRTDCVYQGRISSRSLAERETE